MEQDMLTRTGRWLDVGWYANENLPDMVRLHKRAFPGEVWIAERFCAYAEQENHSCTVAIDEATGRVVATLLYRTCAEVVTIDYLAVIEEDRRDRIATGLMRGLIGASGRLRQRVFEALVPERNLTAQLFFKSLGFKAVEPYTTGGMIPMRHVKQANTGHRQRRPVAV